MTAEELERMELEIAREALRKTDLADELPLEDDNWLRKYLRQEECERKLFMESLRG